MKTIDKLKNHLKKREVGFMGRHRHYAVMLLIVEMNGDCFMLFEKRSANLDVQPGDVCFAGGKIESGETPTFAALRETQEELGIDPSDIELIGEIDRLYEHGRIILYPVIGKVDYSDLDLSKISKDEVAECYLVPLSQVMKRDPVFHKVMVTSYPYKDFPYEDMGLKEGYNWRRSEVKIPIWYFDATEKPIVVWGMTGQILMNFKEILGELALKDEK